MKKNLFFILFLLSIFNYSYGLEKNSVLENKIAKNLRCLVCQGQSIYDSQSEFALSLLKEKLTRNFNAIRKRWDNDNIILSLRSREDYTCKKII